MVDAKVAWRPSLVGGALLGALALSAACAGVTPRPAVPAPVVQPLYLDTRCIGTPSNKGDAYRDYMLAVTAKTMQVRADEGNIAGWIFARSVISTDPDCDFVQVNLHRGFPPARTPIDPYMVKAGLTTNRTEWYARLAELTNAVRRELWQGVEQVGAMTPGNLLRIDHYRVNPRRAAQWQALQTKLWRPAFQAAIRGGASAPVRGWQVDKIFLPAGSAYPYGARTITVLRDWDALGQVAGGTAVAAAFHQGRAGALLAQDLDTQELVRSELFEVVEVIRPRGGVSAAAVER